MLHPPLSILQGCEISHQLEQQFRLGLGSQVHIYTCTNPSIRFAFPSLSHPPFNVGHMDLKVPFVHGQFVGPQWPRQLPGLDKPFTSNFQLSQTVYWPWAKERYLFIGLTRNVSMFSIAFIFQKNFLQVDHMENMGDDYPKPFLGRFQLVSTLSESARHQGWPRK